MVKERGSETSVTQSLEVQTGRIADEAVTALTTLGFQQSASQKVVTAIMKEKPEISIETLIRESLKRI